MEEIMTKSRTEKITDILRGIRISSPEVVGAALVSIEGFVISAVAPVELDEELFGGMAAALLGVGERVAGELIRSKMEQTYVKSANGYVILNAVGEDAVLVLLVTKEARLGLIFLELRRTIPLLLRDIGSS
jgi:predicted regulator of Ras-like GTPase activity (Roadblock/LC7/MglB family)